MLFGWEFRCCLLILLVTSRPACGLLGKSDDRNQTLASVINAAPGSKPPSCLNKCDSCTPCQAVQTVQEASEIVTDIGSRPPSCQNKCNRCLPCQAVQVPTPEPKGAAEQTRSSTPEEPAGEVSSQYSNYKPKGWRCQCGNKLFNP